MDAVRIENLTKVYKDITAVDHLNLTIGQGELLCLLGVNGAGKTTLIKMLSCLTSPSDGDAFLLGNSIRENSREVKKIIAVSPQESALAQNLTVLENLDMMYGIYGFDKTEKEEHIRQISSLLGLDSVLKRKAGKLSGGWQRRLSIAMALIAKPKILFLDEPTLGLDVIARSELWDTIRSLQGKVTVILTTHYMEEAEELSDRIAILRNGKLLICDTADAIKQKAATDSFEKAFIRIVKEGTV